MPKKKAETKLQKEADVLDGYESWLRNRPAVEAHAVSGDIAEDKKKKKKR